MSGTNPFSVGHPVVLLAIVALLSAGIATVTEHPSRSAWLKEFLFSFFALLAGIALMARLGQSLHDALLG